MLCVYVYVYFSVSSSLAFKRLSKDFISYTHKKNMTYFTFKSWLCFLDDRCCYCSRAHGTIQMNHSSEKKQVLPQRGDTMLEKGSIYLQQSRREYSNSLPPKELHGRKFFST